MRRAVWYRGRKWIDEHTPKIDEPEAPPAPRSLEELKEAREQQSKAFDDMLAIVEGRKGGV